MVQREFLVYSNQNYFYFYISFKQFDLNIIIFLVSNDASLYYVKQLKQIKFEIKRNLIFLHRKTFDVLT